MRACDAAPAVQRATDFFPQSEKPASFLQPNTITALAVRSARKGGRFARGVSPRLAVRTQRTRFQRLNESTVCKGTKDGTQNVPPTGSRLSFVDALDHRMWLGPRHERSELGYSRD